MSSRAGADEAVLVWVYGTTTDDEVLKGVLDELSNAAVVHGPSLDPPTRTPDVVVPILSSDAVDETQMREDLAAWSDRIVPIALGGQASRAFGELSQVIPRPGTIHDSAQRILSVARASGLDLASYYRLARTAASWHRSGRPPAGLLSESALTEAESVLAAPQMRLVGGAGEVLRDYVAESRHHRLRRRRRAGVIAGSLGVVLALATGVAQVSQSQADAAQAHALDEAGRENSLRLAAAALDSTQIDPDLPALLAEAALEDARTSEALAAAVQIGATQVPHVTHPLEGVPIGLAVHPSGVIAVGETAGTIWVTSVEDPGDGARLAAVAGVSPWVLAISPDRGKVAVGDRTRIIVHDAKSGTLVNDFTLDGSPMFWVDDERLAVSGDPVRIVEVGTGRVDPFVPGSGEIAAWAVSTDGQRAALLYPDQVRLLSTATLESLASQSVDGGRDVTFTGDGTALVIRTDQGASVWRTLEADDPMGKSDVRLAGPIAAGPGVTVVSVSPYSCEWIELTATGLDDVTAAPCHAGSPVVGVGSLPDGRTVTVGGDRRLRVWGEPPLMRSDALSPPIPLDLFTRYTSAERGRIRGRLAIHPTGDIVALPNDAMAPRGAFRLSPTDLGQVEETKFWRAYGGSVLSPHGTAIALTSDGATGVLDLATGESWVIETGCLSSLAVPTAVSDNAEFAVCQAQTGHVLASQGGARPVISTEPGAAVGVFVSDSGEVGVATKDGVIRDSAGRIARIAPSGAALVAVTREPESGVFVSLDSNAQVHEAVNGELRRIASLTPDLRGHALAVGSDHVAVMGASQTLILARATGTEITRFRIDGTPMGDGAGFDRIDDVAFLGSSAYILGNDNRVARVDLDPTTASAILPTLLARDFTAEERSNYAISGN
jgi:hypothetical protein